MGKAQTELKPRFYLFILQPAVGYCSNQRLPAMVLAAIQFCNTKLSVCVLSTVPTTNRAH